MNLAIRDVKYRLGRFILTAIGATIVGTGAERDSYVTWS